MERIVAMESEESKICGWELNNPDHEVFDLQVLEVLGACKNCDKVRECLTPCESVRCLRPKVGKLVELGRDQTLDGITMTYFALLHREGVKFIQLSEPDHYWARSSYIGREDVPDWALVKLRAEH